MARISEAQSGSEKLEYLLFQVAAKKDQAAFAKLYSATKGKLFSTTILIVKRSAIAEEIIQDAYVRIWLNAGSYNRSLGSPMNWMIIIARNLAIDHVRKSAKVVHSDESMLSDLPADGLTALEEIESLEDQQTAIKEKYDVFFALQSLDRTRRDLIIAAYIYGESREQISNRTGVPINTVKTWIRRSLLEVKAILQNTKNRHEIALSTYRDVAQKNCLERETPMRS